MPEHQDIYPLFFSKNIGAITRDEQEILRNSHVLVAGCGGIGAIAVELLARSGIGNITVADGDTYEFSNLNRQIFSTSGDVGKKKVDVAEKVIKQINPEIIFQAIGENITDQNAETLMNGVNVVVDGLDNALGRVIISRSAKDLGLNYVFGACEKIRGYSTVFVPTGQSYEHIFNLPTNGKELTDKLKERLRNTMRCDAVLGVVSNLIGSIEAMQTINVLLNKDVVTPPEFVHVSAFSKIPVWTGKL